MWFASAKPPYGTLDAAEWAPSTASKADICSAVGHVRFTPESGHVRCTSPCPLWAKSGHWVRLILPHNTDNPRSIRWSDEKSSALDCFNRSGPISPNVVVKAVTSTFPAE